MATFPAVAAALSGVLLLVVGAGLLLARPTRAGGVFYGFFSVLWGAEVVFLNVSRLAASPDTALVLLRIGLALKIPQALVLVYFASSYPRRVAPRRALVAATGAVAAVAAVLFALRPELFVDGMVRTPLGTWTGRYGILNPLLIGIPSFLAFYLTAALLFAKYGTDLPDLERREVGIILVATMTYVAHVSTYYGLYYVLGRDALLPAVGGAVVASFVAVFAVGLLLSLGLAARLASRLRRGTAPEQRATDAAVLAAIVVPGAVGALGALPLAWGGRPFETVGVFRFAATALVAYGILKHHLFGLDLGLKKAVRTGFPVLVAIGAEVLVGGLAQDALQGLSLGGLPLILVTGVVVAAGSAIAALPFRGRAAELLFPHVREDDDYRRARAVEVYKATLAEALAEGRLDGDDLVGLRQRLGLTDRDHEILRLVVRGELRMGGRPPTPPTPARYRRVRLLGERGVVQTWLAEDATLQRKVVLKDVAAPAASLPELRPAAGLADAHVVVLHDVLLEGATTTLVLEHVEGESLQARLDREGRLPRAEALRVAAGVLRGLDALHARGVVHRALKPGNVLLAPDGRAKITDYGLGAGPASGAATRAALLEAVEPGTLRYASPEIAAGESADARSDLYSVGALLYRMLEGRFYTDLGNEGEYALRRRIREDAARLPLRDEPAEVNAVLARALEKDPAKRYGTAREMLGDVERAMAVGA